MAKIFQRFCVWTRRHRLGPLRDRFLSPFRGSVFPDAHISIFFDFYRPPYGGGNQFLLALIRKLERRGFRVENNVISRATRACLFNSYNFDRDRLHREWDRLKKQSTQERRQLLMIHRVDGPIALYRGMPDDPTDKEIVKFNQQLPADKTIFQSRYSMEAHQALGLDLKSPKIIMNAVDPDIFYPRGQRNSLKGRKVRLFSTSWSSNPNKGEATYKWLDENLDWTRYEFAFMGQTEAPFAKIRKIKPGKSHQVADELRQHDIYIAASLNDPCSNALLEALACGLPAVYAASGGHPEIVGEAGFGFFSPEEIPALLDRLVDEYEERRQRIAIPTLGKVTDRYLSEMGLETMPKPRTEICGDIPLSWGSQLRYLLYGLRQIVQSLRRRFPAGLVRMDMENEDIRHKIEEGASPLRVYTLALVRKVLADLPGIDGPICDIGCGSGAQSQFFELMKGRHAYIGIDVAGHGSWSPKAILDHPLICRFAQMTATELGIASDRLALTFSSSTLEHVQDIRQAVAEMARTMRPGACGLHVVPGVWSLFLYLFHGYRRFSPAELVDLFDDAGLKVERIWSMGGLPSFLLHVFWITGMETIILRGLRMKAELRKGLIGCLYSQLLRLSLRLDPFLPFAPAGYGVVVRKL